ncbi:MAG: diguanylate cyclase [Lachnospiraceae bacterium]|nr:diguanylate cyclase [Lachnospiraceae bacterium]
MKKIRITTRTVIVTAVIGSVLLITFIIASMLRSYRQTVSVTNEAVSSVSSFYLEAMADRRAKTITNLINNNFEYMKKALSFIEEEGIESQEDLRTSLGKVKTLLSLNRFALVDEDDIVYTQYTTYTGGSRHDFLRDGNLNSQSISIVFLYGSSKQLCLAIPTPGFEIMGKSFKACFVQIDIGEIVNLLAFDDQGRTYFALYSPSGENLSDTELGPTIANQNLFDATRKLITEQEGLKLNEDFERGTGSLTFISDGVEETLVYVPIENTDWKMAVLIRESVINERIRDISEHSLVSNRRQIIIVLALVILFATILLLELRIMSRRRLEAERETSRAFKSMANTDSMTGIRNKHAYIETEAALNELIAAEAAGPLAVAVCDVNGLKHVNDTLGHAAGDQLIKDASSLICEYFNHGAVFRVGGDEFTVLLQGKGYDTLHEVVDAFNRRAEENIADGSVVVSLGYAILTPSDKELHDVFERADKMMYERKKELKEMGAHTRL